MARLDDRWGPHLEGLSAKGGRRVLKPGRPEGAAALWRNGRRLINFSSNDYLGLAGHPALIERARAWTEEWGAGARSSRLVTGTTELHAALEDKLARLKGAEAGLILNSGYQANSAILPALFDRRILGAEAVVFADTLIHASLHHGCRSAGVRPHLFRHSDLDHLEELLNEHGGGARFIITESVFSMDGDRADLTALAGLAERHDAFLYVDDAHATGVLGPQGLGLASTAGTGIDLVMGTFSKGLGGFGAYVVCSAVMKDYLVNRCRGLIYSTALPPGVLGAMDAALDIVPTLDAERQRLHAGAEALRQALSGAGLDTAGSTTQIVPALIGEVDTVLAVSAMLEEAGVLGIAIRPPTVPVGTSRIRFAVTADHSSEDLDALIALVPRMAKMSQI